MTLGVVIVNYGSSHDLSSANLDWPDIIVVIVDNFSSEDESRRISALAHGRRWNLISLDSNIGFGAAATIGADRAAELGCESLLFLNPDAQIDSKSVAVLQSYLTSNGRSMVSPVVLRPDGTVWFGGGELDERRGLPSHSQAVMVSPRWLTGACLMMTTDVWRESGGFAGVYFLYWEDVELTSRWSQLGDLLVAADAVATHAVGGTQQSAGLKSPIYIEFNVRNRRLFAKRNLEFRQRALWSFSTPFYIRSLLRVAGGRKMVRDRRLIRDFVAPVARGLFARLPG